MDHIFTIYYGREFLSDKNMDRAKNFSRDEPVVPPSFALAYPIRAGQQSDVPFVLVIST